MISHVLWHLEWQIRFSSVRYLWKVLICLSVIECTATTSLHSLYDDRNIRFIDFSFKKNSAILYLIDSKDKPVFQLAAVIIFILKKIVISRFFETLKRNFQINAALSLAFIPKFGYRFIITFILYKVDPSLLGTAMTTSR